MYGRDLLRKAGQKIQAFDEAYGDRFSKAIVEPLDERFRGNPLILPAVLASEPAFRKYSEADYEVPKIAAYGVPAVAATARYVVPAAGVGLAAKGIYDLTQSLNQQTSGTIEL